MIPTLDPKAYKWYPLLASLDPPKTRCSSPLTQTEVVSPEGGQGFRVWGLELTCDISGAYGAPIVRIVLFVALQGAPLFLQSSQNPEP